MSTLLLEELSSTRGCFWCLANITGHDDCWIWTGRISEKGYGLFSKYRAHRVAWVLANNSAIPNDICVCHRCDVRPCVNPFHLFLGTQVENIHDMYGKRRQGPRYFGEKNSAAVLTPEDIRFIRSSTSPGIMMAKHFGVTNANISSIRNMKTWRHIND